MGERNEPSGDGGLFSPAFLCHARPFFTAIHTHLVPTSASCQLAWFWRAVQKQETGPNRRGDGKNATLRFPAVSSTHWRHAGRLDESVNVKLEMSVRCGEGAAAKKSATHTHTGRLESEFFRLGSVFSFLFFRVPPVFFHPRPGTMHPYSGGSTLASVRAACLIGRRARASASARNFGAAADGALAASRLRRVASAARTRLEHAAVLNPWQLTWAGGGRKRQAQRRRKKKRAAIDRGRGRPRAPRRSPFSLWGRRHVRASTSCWPTANTKQKGGP